MLRISALHALILALVFAQEMSEYQQLKLESAAETNALADIYFDAGRYGAHRCRAHLPARCASTCSIVIERGVGQPRRRPDG